MPARRLTDVPSPTPQYAAIGGYALSGTNPGFVRHVALLKNETGLFYGVETDVWHMGPPLIAGPITLDISGRGQKVSAHVTGHIDLDRDEIDAIRDWLSEVDKERGPFGHRRYVAHPHCRWHLSPESGSPLYRRFSCAGFVIECYRAANVDLVVTDEGQLPLSGIALLGAVYSLDDLQRFGERIGLDGSGPWPVILPGFLFHAFAKHAMGQPRPSPYVPVSTDDAKFG